MIFLQTNSILVEIQQVTYKQDEQLKQLYLIGNQQFEDLPTSIVLNSFVSANWNRALKYKVINQDLNINNIIETKIGYHKLSFDLYLNLIEMKVEVLTKNNFDNKVVSQQPFLNDFLLKIINSYNKFKTDNNTLIPNNLLLNNIINFTKEKHKDINNYIVNDSFDINNKKYKWKKLIVISDHSEIVKTKHGQLIYYIDNFKLDNQLTKYISFADIKTNTIYVQGYVETQTKLYVNFNFEDNINLNEIKNNIKVEIQNIVDNKEELPFHLYNVTLDDKYLLQALNSYDKLNYFETKLALDKVFNSLSNNYYSKIYSINNLKEIMFNKINDQDELNDYLKNVRRFGIIGKVEKEKIDDLKNKLNK